MSTNYSEIASAVTEELIESAKGTKTSFPFIRHVYSNNKLARDGEVFQVLVVGGSMYKSVLLRRERGKFTPVSAREGSQPIFRTEADFLEFTAAQIDPNVRVLAINMAFPLTPSELDGRIEGILAYATKEHTFKGMIGKPVARTIQDYIKKVRGQEILASVANDTICLLLSGLTQYKWDQIAAGIVGTGMNFAIFENQNTLVNLEAANFDKFEASEEGKRVDKKSSKPGMARTEKEVAGAYLHQIFNEGLKIHKLPHAPLGSTAEIDEIAKNGSGELKDYAESVLERSAGLVAAEMAGIARFIGHETTFVMEGSLFWKGFKYHERVEQKLRLLVPDYKVLPVYIPDSGIMGAAKLVA